MNGKIETKANQLDSWKWFLVASLVVSGLAANYYFGSTTWLIRLTVGVMLLSLTLIIALWTRQGKYAWEFLREARIEARKVIWPTRQETVQTTLVVVAMVTVMALLLWGIDGLLIWIIGWLTGQRG